MLLRRPLGALTRLLIPRAATEPSVYYICMMAEEVLLYGLPALLLLLPGRRAGKSQVRPSACFLCAALGAACQVLTQVVTQVWSALLALVVPALPQSTLLMPRNAPEAILALLALAVVPALAEEALFRGGTYAALRTALGERRAAAVCIASFALMHGTLTGLPAHFFVSLAAFALLHRCRSLLAPILFHMSYNAMALLCALRPALLPLLSLPPAAAVGVCALFLLPVGGLLLRLDRALTEDAPAHVPLSLKLLGGALLCLLLLGYAPDFVILAHLA